VSPQGNRGGSQGHADRGVADRRKSPVERRAQIVDCRAVVCQPFVRWPRFRFGLGAFEKIQIASGMASRRPVELASLYELLERISSGRFEQPMAYHRAASVGGHERFRDQVHNAIDDARCLNLVIRSYRTRGLQCEAPGKIARRRNTARSGSVSSS
jgi:hypothetical protein